MVVAALAVVLGSWGVWLYFRPGEANRWPNSTSPAIGYLGTLGVVFGLLYIATN